MGKQSFYLFPKHFVKYFVKKRIEKETSTQKPHIIQIIWGFKIEIKNIEIKRYFTILDLQASEWLSTISLEEENFGNNPKWLEPLRVENLCYQNKIKYLL